MTLTASADVAAAFDRIKEESRARSQGVWDGARPIVAVGTATCGRSAGALETLQAFKDEVAKRDLDVELLEVGCMGHCYAEPLVVISKPEYPPIVYGYVTPEIARRLVQDYLEGEDFSPEFMLGAMEASDLIPSILDQPRFAYEKQIVLENVGRIDPLNIDHYVSRGGYGALARALQMRPEDVIEVVKRSGLRGRGGAGFPTGEKWETCRAARGKTRYVICNADEGDPGAFMDRAILESDPHSVVEGMAVAGYAVGAKHGYIYVRAEYPLAVNRVQTALAEARRVGLLGKNVLNSGFSFDVEVYQGSGAFVCGEETALIASLEGRSGMPRHRPPFPSTVGLEGKPTLIDNVKTVAYVPRILNVGAERFSSAGTEQSPGTAVFALAGKVVNTGLTEVPMGTTLRDIVYGVGGGIPGARRFKALQTGGPSGGCLPESALDLPVDFESLRDAGAMMGSGGMVVLDEDDCMVEIARYFLEFTQRESCGKCTMCRLGTKEMLDILTRITKGEGRMEDLDALQELAEDIKDGSLCGLGRTAPNPVLTTLRYFRDEYEAHIKEGRCPALMCQDLITYYILPEKCERSCDACVGTCTVEAIYSNRKGIKVIDQEKCVKCNTCLEACPPQYNAVVKLSPPSEVPAVKDEK